MVVQPLVQLAVPQLALDVKAVVEQVAMAALDVAVVALRDALVVVQADAKAAEVAAMVVAVAEVVVGIPATTLVTRFAALYALHIAGVRVLQVAKDATIAVAAPVMAIARVVQAVAKDVMVVMAVLRVVHLDAQGVHLLVQVGVQRTARLAAISAIAVVQKHVPDAVVAVQVHARRALDALDVLQVVLAHVETDALVAQDADQAAKAVAQDARTLVGVDAVRSALVAVPDAMAVQDPMEFQVEHMAQLALAQDALVQVDNLVHPVALLALVKVVVVVQAVVLLTAQKAVAKVAVQFALQVVRLLAMMAALTLVKQPAQQRVPIPVPISAMAQVREQYKFINGG